jgi:hypothetical protein
MPSILSIITPDPNVVGTTLENGETVLMHMGTASYFTLNSTGTQIWDLLSKGVPLAEICEALVATYEVSAAQSTTSVLTLVAQLAAQHLLTVTEAAVHG